MTIPVDAQLRRPDPYGLERRTTSQSIPRIADPSATRREAVIFWSLISVTVLATFATLVAGGAGGPDGTVVRLTSVFAVGLALLYSVRASMMTGIDKETRGSWQLIACSMAISVSLGALMFVGEKNDWTHLLRFRAAVPIIPQLVMIASVLRLPNAPRSAIDRSKLILDVATVVVGTAIVGWYDIVTSPWASTPGLLLRGAFLHISVICDLVLLLLASVMWRRTTSRTRGTILGLLAAGFFIHIETLTLLLLYQRING